MYAHKMKHTSGLQCQNQNIHTLLSISPTDVISMKITLFNIIHYYPLIFFKKSKNILRMLKLTNTSLEFMNVHRYKHVSI